MPRAARVAFRWLRAVALERIGDIDAAERELLAAESMDTDWPLPLLDLARIASDRGDVERDWRCCAAPAPGRTTRWWSYWSGTGPSRAATGRNEPCWCGSGRKYKKCHLGARSCHWPSGWAGCTRRPASTRC